MSRQELQGKGSLYLYHHTHIPGLAAGTWFGQKSKCLAGPGQGVGLAAWAGVMLPAARLGTHRAIQPSPERTWLNPIDRLRPSRRLRLGCTGTALRHGAGTVAGASLLPAGPAGLWGQAEARQPLARTGSSLRVGQEPVALGMSRSQHGAGVSPEPTPRSC